MYVGMFMCVSVHGVYPPSATIAPFVLAAAGGVHVGVQSPVRRHASVHRAGGYLDGACHVVEAACRAGCRRVQVLLRGEPLVVPAPVLLQCR